MIIRKLIWLYYTSPIIFRNNILYVTKISLKKKKFGFLSLPWSSLSHAKRVSPSLDLGLRVTFLFSVFFLLFSLAFHAMADDVATGLGKMKLTSDEEEVIAISDEGRL